MVAEELITMTDEEMIKFALKDLVEAIEDYKACGDLQSFEVYAKSARAYKDVLTAVTLKKDLK